MMGGLAHYYECIEASVFVHWLAKPLTREELSVRHCAALEIKGWDPSMAFISSPSPSQSLKEPVIAEAR